MKIQSMDLLLQYFRELSEGHLDITKTVEYRFIQTLQDLDTPISLNEFAKALNMTSIVYNFIGLMTEAGLLNQSPQGIGTNILLPIDDEELESSDAHAETSPTNKQDINQQETTPEAVKSTSVPLTPPPAVGLDNSSNNPLAEGSAKSSAKQEELPPSIQRKLEKERAKTGKAKRDQITDEDLWADFDKLGSLEDDLDK